MTVSHAGDFLFLKEESRKARNQYTHRCAQQALGTLNPQLRNVSLSSAHRPLLLGRPPGPLPLLQRPPVLVVPFGGP
jgi:hypothetical protein